MLKQLLQIVDLQLVLLDAGDQVFASANGCRRKIIEDRGRVLVFDSTRNLR